MPYAIKTFREAVNGTPATLAAEMQVWFTANPTIIVLSVSQSRFFSTTNSEQLVVRLLYRYGPAQGFGFLHRADLVAGDSTTTLAAAYTAFAAANPTFYHLFSIEATQRTSRLQDYGSVIVISTAEAPRFGGEVYVAEPLGNIVIGGIGNAKIYNSNGSVVNASTPIRNVSMANDWPAGERNLMVYDQDTCVRIGIPSCCP
jgi:hypothetical protein